MGAYASRIASTTGHDGHGKSFEVRGADVSFGSGNYDFSAPDPIPAAAQKRVQELLECGRLFRYQGDVDDVAKLERDFSDYIGLPCTMACNSGGCGLFLALKALKVQPGDKVLVNAWTLAPVPGAIVHAGATPVFVDSDPKTLTIDLQDLEIKAGESGANVLLLSYMRGQVPDLDALFGITRRLGLEVIEDCAHTLGARWKMDDEDAHRHIGTFGAVGVWSLQTNKSINCGEGGLISTARQEIASFITIATGSYGHFHMNGASGDLDQLKQAYPNVPNMSMRMTTLAAALALPQLAAFDEKMHGFERNAMLIREALEQCVHVRTVQKPNWLSKKETIVWSSIQFELPGFSEGMVERVVANLADVGIPLAWFGRCKGFTSTLRDWKFADPEGKQWSDKCAATTQRLVDLPLYHTSRWPEPVITRLSEILRGVIEQVAASDMHVPPAA